MPFLTTKGGGSTKGFGKLTVVLPGFVSGLSSSKNNSTIQALNVSWSAPTSGPAPTAYIVTASPGGATQTVSGTSATFTGLTANTSYTFTVQTRRNNTNGKISSSNNSNTPSAYICSFGSVSGSNCTYTGQFNSGYGCPDPYGNCAVGVGCGWTDIIPTGQTAFGGPGRQSCCWNFGFCYGGNWMNLCCDSFAFSYYSCPNGGNASGSTCSFSASIG